MTATNSTTGLKNPAEISSAILHDLQLGFRASLLQLAHASFAEALVYPVHPICQFPPSCAFGKLGAPATTRCFETAAPTTAIRRARQIVLGDFAADLAGMEAGFDSDPTGDRCSLAPGGVQIVLDVALAASNPRGTKVSQ